MPRSQGQRLTGCHVVSLRPAGDQAALRRAAAREGAHLLALAPWRIVARDDAATHGDLQAALRASRVVFTSPSAVKAARALAPLQARRDQAWLAVGAGTARALRDAGVATGVAPARMDSEGVLQLEALQSIAGIDVGLVTAPGGRGLIAAELHARGARVLRADVYARVPVAIAPAAVQRLLACSGDLWLALSSAEALQRVEAALPEQAWQCLLRARVAAASERLAALARSRGFPGVAIARGPRPGDLVAALAGATEAARS